MEQAIKMEQETQALPVLLEKVDEADRALSNLREAIDVPSRTEIDEMITQKIIDLNMLNKIELKNGDAPPVVLSDQPRHFLFPEILTSVNCNIPTALIGPAGSGKSTVAEQVAEALSLSFYLQNAVSGAHELTGYMDAYGKYHGTTFRTSYEFGGLLFIDEVDTSDAGALKWANTAIANGYAMFPDSAIAIKRHVDFRIIMAANTFGNGADRVYVGANQLDGSTLDRFVFFDFNYDEKLEVALSGNPKWTERVQLLRLAAGVEKARMIISPRASINGAKLLAAGWDEATVENRVIWKGIDPELRKRIETCAGKTQAKENLDEALSWKKRKEAKRRR